MSHFLNTAVNIEGNEKLRKPQIKAYLDIRHYFEENSDEQEILVVLPTGTGKSGLIAIIPYGISKGRVLVITPGLVTKKSVIKTLDPLDDNFWINYDVIFDPSDQPTIVEYDPDVLTKSLEKADYVITNVHKLQISRDTSLLNRVPPDFFDVIIIDEAHHSVATSWQEALRYFRDAKKIHLTGTPYRGDGQELPGVRVHETLLSEVMADKYVKLLRKTTVNNFDMLFRLPGDPKSYDKDEILRLKDQEWIEKSVALSKECSQDVINKSLEHLKVFRKGSPNVPHKILAVGCSIAHADDLYKWYKELGVTPVIVHSDMGADELEESFKTIENDDCDVVVSVNMLMEGYDHKYLSVLALFRPYRSLNAFAQVVGRVLRAIPEDEINDFNFDNNAIIIYHEETGLDTMWEYFQKEVEDSKHFKIREYSISDQEYAEREYLFGGVETGEIINGDTDSYIKSYDFNDLFERARAEIAEVKLKARKKFEEDGFDPDTIEKLAKVIEDKEIDKRKDTIDPELIEKRPEIARKLLRNIIKDKAERSAAEILDEKKIDQKGHELYHKFKGILEYRIDNQSPNDAVLVIYFNTKLFHRFGRIAERSLTDLQRSEKHLDKIIEEVRRMSL